MCKLLLTTADLLHYLQMEDEARRRDLRGKSAGSAGLKQGAYGKVSGEQ